jgi:hypothetical protein
VCIETIKMNSDSFTNPTANKIGAFPAPFALHHSRCHMQIYSWVTSLLLLLFLVKLVLVRVVFTNRFFPFCRYSCCNSTTSSLLFGNTYR